MDLPGRGKYNLVRNDQSLGPIILQVDLIDT
jgi:hypothetical protein